MDFLQGLALAIFLLEIVVLLCDVIVLGMGYKSMLHFDLEEGHDQKLLEAWATMPDKPKKRKVLKIRNRKVIDGLLLLFKVFEELDADGKLPAEEQQP